LKNLLKHGVVIENSSTEEQTVTKVPVVESLGAYDYYDLAMVPVRKNQAMKILPDLAANKKVPTSLFMMNNAKGQEKFVETLEKDRFTIGFPLPVGERDGHVIPMLPVNVKE